MVYKEIEFELKNSNIGMYVLHDIVIEYEDLKAQFDYIIITKGFTYLVECKNLIGNITVNNKGDFIREYEINGNKIKEGIYSPYTQISRHKEILRKKIQSNASFIRKLLLEKNFDKYMFKSLVVLANHKAVLNTYYAPREIKKDIIKVDQLISYIKKDLDNYDKDYYYSKNKMLSLANSILENNTNNVYDFANKYKNTPDMIREKLLNYRKDKAKDRNIPAYYIFTNEELEKIMLNLPTSLEELKKMNILSDVKIKYHGEEIVNIISYK